MDRARIGIVGAGQLGRMLALAACPLGVEIRFLDHAADAPGGRLAPIRAAALDDATALAELAADVDVLTYETENISTETLAALDTRTPIRPGLEIAAVAQDRLAEKRLFADLGISTAPYAVVDSQSDLDAAAAELGWPIVLKARRWGYDGRGQRFAGSATELKDAWQALERVPALAEGHVQFERELSLIAARGASGEIAFYGLSENRHAGGILVETRAPYGDARLQRTAEQCAAAILERFDYRGVLAIEFFEAGGGLVANEIAPRVHNSGHWTIEGAETSQFENHVRAILDWPLGTTDARGHAVMVNLLGSMPPAHDVLGVPGAHLHDYGKTPRPARKLGHATLVDTDQRRLEQRLEALRGAVRAGDR